MSAALVFMPRLVKHLEAEIPPNAQFDVPHRGQWGVEDRELDKVLQRMINAIEHTIAPGTSEATKRQVVSGVLAEADAALVAKYTAARPSARSALAEWTADMARLARVPPWAALVIYMYTMVPTQGQTEALHVLVNRTLHEAADDTDPARRQEALERLNPALGGLGMFVESLAEALHHANDDLPTVFAPQAQAGADKGHLYRHVGAVSVPHLLSRRDQINAWHSFTSTTVDPNVTDGLRRQYARDQPDGPDGESHIFTAVVPFEPSAIPTNSAGQRIVALEFLPNVRVFSAFPKEQEVLLVPGMQFWVMGYQHENPPGTNPNSVDRINWAVYLVGQVKLLEELRDACNRTAADPRNSGGGNGDADGGFDGDGGDANLGGGRTGTGGDGGGSPGRGDGGGSKRPPAGPAGPKSFDAATAGSGTSHEFPPPSSSAQTVREAADAGGYREALGRLLESTGGAPAPDFDAIERKRLEKFTVKQIDAWKGHCGSFPLDEDDVAAKPKRRWRNPIVGVAAKAGFAKALLRLLGSMMFGPKFDSEIFLAKFNAGHYSSTAWIDADNYNRPGTTVPDTAFPEAATLDDVDESLQCPITKATLVDPVVASDGYVYERRAIEHNINVDEKSGRRAARSPMTNEPLANTKLDPCTVTKACLHAWQRHLESAAPAGHTAGEMPAAMAAGGAGSYAGAQAVSIRSKLLEEVDRLVKDIAAAGLSDSALAQPAIVSVGLESVGKSTVLERLVGFAVLPRDQARCTRMPIRVILRRGPWQPPELRVAPLNATTTSSERQWRRLPAVLPLDMIPSVVKEVMDAEVAGKQFIADRELQITIQAPHAPQLHLLDLPGLPGSDHGEDGRDAAKDLLRQTVERVKGTSRFLWIHAAPDELSNSSISSVLRQCGVMERTTGVLTRCDVFMPSNGDESKPTDLARMLRRGGKGRHGDVDGPELWYAAANRASNKGIDKAWTAQGKRGSKEQVRLIDMQTREKSEFEYLLQLGAAVTSPADERLLRERWGMDALRQQEQREYEAFITEHWVPSVRRKLLSRIDEEHVTLLRHGWPHTGGGLASTELASEVRRFVETYREALADVGVGAAAAAARCAATAGPAVGTPAFLKKHGAAQLMSAVDTFELRRFADGAFVAAERMLTDSVETLLCPAEVPFGPGSRDMALRQHLVDKQAALDAAGRRFVDTVTGLLVDPATAQSFVRFIRKREGAAQREQASPKELAEIVSKAAGSGSGGGLQLSVLSPECLEQLARSLRGNLTFQTQPEPSHPSTTTPGFPAAAMAAEYAIAFKRAFRDVGSMDNESTSGEAAAVSHTIRIEPVKADAIRTAVNSVVAAARAAVRDAVHGLLAAEMEWYADATHHDAMRQALENCAAAGRLYTTTLAEIREDD